MTTPAGWYPDPSDAASQRWFDGTRWTDSVRRVDAPPPPSSPYGPPPSPYGAGPGQWGGGGGDVVGTPARTGLSTLSKVLLAGGAAVAALGVAGGAYALSALSGGGAQPESALPASAVAYAEIDLDPAAGQKLAVFRLASRFPRAQVQDEDDVQDDLLAQLLEDALPEGTSYARDVQPWIGSRAGIAALSQLDEDDEPLAALALQVADEGEAKAGLGRLRAAAERHGGNPVGFAFSGDYVVVAETQATADRVVADAEKAPLADAAQYREALDALGGDQIATGYLDVDGLYEVLPAEAKAQLTDSPLFDGDARPSGSLVVGASAGADHVEITGRAVDLETGLGQERAIGAAAGSQLVQDMPADAVAALSVTGLGEGLSRLYGQAQDALDDADSTDDGGGEGGFGGDLFGFDQALDEYDLDLPKDLEAVFGDQLAVAVVGDEPDVAVRVRGGDADRALEIVEQVDTSGETDGLVRKEGEDLLVASTPDALEQAAADGGLGDSEVFRTAVPDVEDAGVVLFVDVAKAVAAFDAAGDGDALDEEDRADLEQLEAVGLTARGGRDGGFTLRVTVR
ncbi:MAG: hypothetical protein JWO60_2286 [Frankiales bacterium]|nr:hypothetical protein [Frankiales bacterium]